MRILRAGLHSINYGLWLVGQIFKESLVMAVDTFGSGRNIAPVMVYYPLRIRNERDIAAFAASITMTPGTLALGVTGPKEVDYDAAAGERSTRNAFEVASKEFDAYGEERTQRYLAVHAMYGHNPREILEGLAEMEEKLMPSLRGQKAEFDVPLLIERGRPGPRGFRGSRGGRASDEKVFDADKVDSTPHTQSDQRRSKHKPHSTTFVQALLDGNENHTHLGADVDAAAPPVRKHHEFQPDIDTFAEDLKGDDEQRDAGQHPGRSTPSNYCEPESTPDREGRTKPGETLYDPLYPSENPEEGDVDGSKRDTKQSAKPSGRPQKSMHAGSRAQGRKNKLRRASNKNSKNPKRPPKEGDHL